MVKCKAGPGKCGLWQGRDKGEVGEAPPGQKRRGYAKTSTHHKYYFPVIVLKRAKINAPQKL